MEVNFKIYFNLLCAHPKPNTPQLVEGIESWTLGAHTSSGFSFSLVEISLIQENSHWYGVEYTFILKLEYENFSSIKHTKYSWFDIYLGHMIILAVSSSCGDCKVILSELGLVLTLLMIQNKLNWIKEKLKAITSHFWRMRTPNVSLELDPSMGLGPCLDNLQHSTLTER